MRMRNGERAREQVGQDREGGKRKNNADERGHCIVICKRSRLRTDGRTDGRTASLSLAVAPRGSQTRTLATYGRTKRGAVKEGMTELVIVRVLSRLGR